MWYEKNKGILRPISNWLPGNGVAEGKRETTGYHWGALWDTYDFRQDSYCPACGADMTQEWQPLFFWDGMHCPKCKILVERNPHKCMYCYRLAYQDDFARVENQGNFYGYECPDCTKKGHIRLGFETDQKYARGRAKRFENVKVFSGAKEYYACAI